MPASCFLTVSMQNHSFLNLMPTWNFKFYQQRSVSSQLATFFQDVFVLSDTQTCKTLRIQFCEQSWSKQAAMAVSQIRSSWLLKICLNMQKRLARIICEEAFDFKWRTATTHRPCSRQTATFWYSGKNLNCILKLFHATDFFLLWQEYADWQAPMT